MKRIALILPGLALVLFAAVTLAQQHDGESRQHQQQPSRGMHEMMPMMMEMHQRHAAMANAWSANDKGVFVVRSGQLLKYDDKLNVVKAVDLPKTGAEAADKQEAAAAGDKPAARQKRMEEQMRQRMAQMHGRLPVRIELTGEAVFVSHGDTLLKYSHDLELQAQAQLPAAKAMRCPMCEMMMKRMQDDHGHHGGGRADTEE